MELLLDNHKGFNKLEKLAIRNTVSDSGVMGQLSQVGASDLYAQYKGYP